MADAAPLTPDDIDARLAALGVPAEAPLAIGLSGGADSSALAFALKHRKLTALTVDHGLRPEAAAEAEAVARWCAGLGIAHEILVWSGTKPAAGIQAAAQDARYALLDGWCRANGVRFLLTAHHLEDQAETFLLRLARGSGVSGLAAMAGDAPGDGVRHMRPLLDVPKARLVETLRTAGLDWIEDPSNENTAFQRVRVRNFLASTDIEGMTPDRLAATAGRMARAREALDWATENVLRGAAHENEFGSVTFSFEALSAVPEEIGLRALAAILRTVGGAVYPGRLSQLEGLWAALRDPEFRGASLDGVLFQRGEGGIIALREAAAMRPMPVSAGETARFDNRFDFAVPAGLKAPLAIAALGEDGWRQVKLHAVAAPAPHAARLALPALWHHETVIAVPLLGHGPGSCRFKPLFPLVREC